MINFNIFTQLKKDLDDFATSKILIASKGQGDTVRYLKDRDRAYAYNQAETINLIDLYTNSQFESGSTDSSGQRKLFLNVGTFRTEVAAKQVDIDVKDFRFLPDDYASPWTALFLQKDFREWTKETESGSDFFGELVNTLVENYPKYGTVVVKSIGKRRLEFVPLQNLKNDQSASSLAEARYVIEEHPAMTAWELKDMAQSGWNVDGVGLRYDETVNVYERYGHVPLSWLKSQNKESVQEGESEQYVDAFVVVGKKTGSKEKEGYVFFAKQILNRPYREAHWSRIHGRWLGVGVMESLFPNQNAKNIIINLYRKSLHWSSKRVFQSASSDNVAKGLVASIPDGTILEVGQSNINPVDLSNRSTGEFEQFLNQWERNADQKAFTYEVATGESLPSGTPFRLGVILQNAVNSFYAMKREKLGLFLKKCIMDFLFPEFFRDMGDAERVVAMFSDEAGFETLRAAALEYVKGEVIRTSLLSGQVVDPSSIVDAIEPFQAIQTLLFKLPKNYYQTAKYKFELSVTGEEVNVEGKIETLKSLFQILAPSGDPRAEKILQKIAALAGEDMATFGLPRAPQAPQTIGTNTPLPQQRGQRVPTPV